MIHEILQCDFCSMPGPVWRYPALSFIAYCAPNVAGESVGDWAAGVAIALVWEWARSPRIKFFPGWRFVAPGLLLLLAAHGAMAIYFRAVTGSAFEMPYQVNRATYGWPMTQAWMPPAVASAALRHKSMRDYYLWESRY